MVIYTKPNYVTVSLDGTNPVVIFDFENYNLSVQDAEEMLGEALKKTLQFGCYYYIADSSKVQTALPGEVIDWWGETWVPKLVEAGLKAIVTVVPSNAIAHMSTDSWQTKVTGGITQKNVKTLEEAHALVHQLRLEEFQL